MNYQVFFVTRWFKDVRFCGGFPTLRLAYAHVNYLQRKLPKGNKLTFKITGIL